MFDTHPQADPEPPGISCLSSAGPPPLQRSLYGKSGYRVGLALLLAGGGVLLAAHARHRWREILSPLWVRTVHDIAYGPRPQNRLNILRRRWSTGEAGRPAVIVFHGGGWREGSREEMLVPFCHPYLEHGFVVANVEYRVGAIPAAVDDAVMALQWFVRHAAEYGANPARIVVTGVSAGGHLALMAALRSDERTAAVVNFYGVTDLVRMLDRPAIRVVLPPDHPELAARALSPVTYVRAGMPPVFSVHGTADDLVPPAQTALLTSAIKEAGGEAYAFYVPGGGHGFSRDQLQAANAAIFEFLKRRGILDK
jgi:acetyl esterase/lipase